MAYTSNYAPQQDQYMSAALPGGTTNLNTPEYYQQQRTNIQTNQPMYDAAINIPQPTSQPPASRSDYTSYAPQTDPFASNPPPPTSPQGPDSGSLQPPDAGAIRRRLMGTIPGANDQTAAGLPYNANFDTGVQNLYATTMGKMTRYDASQNLLQTGYEKSRDYQLQNQDLAMKQLMDRMAFQGILSSGITTDQRALLGQTYAQRLDNLASKQAQALNDLQTQRLATQGDYQSKLAGLESQYTSDVVNWLQSQAQQQAARQQQQAQDDANAQLLQQLQQAYNPQPEAVMDYGTLLGSLDPTNLPTFEAPGGFLDKFFQNKTQILDQNGQPLGIPAILALLQGQPQ